MYGLPQASIHANKLLIKRLAQAGYHPCQFTPGLWRHVWRPVKFCLVVDDFGRKTVGLRHAKHLKQALEKFYEVSVDWKGELFCGVNLKWDYKQPMVDLSMPTYIPAALHRLQHKPPTKPHHAPYKAAPFKFGAATQTPPKDNTPPLSPDKIKYVQQVVGVLLYFGQAVDPTSATALSSISSQQAKGTTAVLDSCNQLLDYCVTHPNPSI